MTVGNFTFSETSIQGVYIIETKRYGDARGYFMETYKKSDFDAAGLVYDFVQDNQSSSRRGVLRGLHFQKTHPQANINNEKNSNTQTEVVKEDESLVDTQKVKWYQKISLFFSKLFKKK